MTYSLLQFLNGDKGKTMPFFTLIREASTDSRFCGKLKIRRSQIEDSAKPMTVKPIVIRFQTPASKPYGQGQRGTLRARIKFKG
jgi:hypothetical protein